MRSFVLATVGRSYGTVFGAFQLGAALGATVSLLKEQLAMEKFNACDGASYGRD
jgi:hypothetical protein